MTAEKLPADELDQLLEAVVAVGGELRLPVVLRRIVETAVDLVDATYGALGVLHPDGDRLEEFIYVGIDKATAGQIGHLPEGRGLLGTLITEPKPLRLENLTDHPDSAGVPANHPPMRSFLGVPITVRGEVFGNLYLTDKVGEPAFTQRDEQLVVALATAAAMGIENARLHTRISDLVVVEDRERIARELHDTVIQRIFATGLALQGLIERCDEVEVKERLGQAVEDLDDTVRDIRTTIFELQRPHLPGRSLRRELLDLATELGETFGFEASTRFAGPIDSLIDPPLAEELLAVTRELLTNVGKHAEATRADLSIVLAGHEVELLVIDNGRGFEQTASPAGGLGLGNVTARAANRGGKVEIHSNARSGTTVVWRVPQED